MEWKLEKFDSVESCWRKHQRHARRYQCSPKNCVPKAVVRKIADRLAFGVSAGHEEDYEWHILV